VGHRSGLPDLLVVHADGPSARRSIERLSRSGVDGGAIVLLGRAEVVTAGRYADRQVDLGSSLALGGRVVRGASIGCLPGAAFGALVLALAAGTDATVLLAGAGGGALFGASVGILVGLLSTPTMAGSWERTFAPMVPGGIAIGVRIGDQRSRRRADRALRGSGAMTVREVSDLDDLPPDPREPSIDG
jgi:hypothetical protein